MTFFSWLPLISRAAPAPEKRRFFSHFFSKPDEQTQLFAAEMLPPQTPPAEAGLATTGAIGGPRGRGRGPPAWCQAPWVPAPQGALCCPWGGALMETQHLGGGICIPVPSPEAAVSSSEAEHGPGQGWKNSGRNLEAVSQRHRAQPQLAPCTNTAPCPPPRPPQCPPCTPFPLPKLRATPVPIRAALGQDAAPLQDVPKPGGRGRCRISPPLPLISGCQGLLPPP